MTAGPDGLYHDGEPRVIGEAVGREVSMVGRLVIRAECGMALDSPTR